MISNVVPLIYSNSTSASHIFALVHDKVYKRKQLSSWIYTRLEGTLHPHSFKKPPMDYSAEVDWKNSALTFYKQTKQKQ